MKHADEMREELADVLDGLDRPRTWAPVDLTAALAGEGPPPPQVARFTADLALFYAGSVNGLHGETEAGKGWVALVAVAQVLAEGGEVLYVDFEDRADRVVARLRDDLGVPVSSIMDRFNYVRPSTPIGAELLELLDLAGRCTLAIVDGMTEAMSVHGLSPESNVDVAVFMALLCRPLADAGPAVVTIDHVTKSREGRGRFAIGGQHKLAMIDGAAFEVIAITPFARGRPGRVGLKVAKDRSGHHRTGETVAELVYDGDTFELRRSASTDDAGNFRPTTLMGRAWSTVDTWPGDDAPTKEQILLATYGKRETLRTAIEQLVAEGFLDPFRDGNRTRYAVSNTWAEA